MSKSLKDQLVEETLRARERIYRVNGPTALNQVTIPGLDCDVYLKREDLSMINAYKWRGAYNCMATLQNHDHRKPVVAASAGNHAQGVALASRLLGIKSKIYMPLSAPKMKQDAVKKHGGDFVEVVLTGDSYNEASDAALEYVAKKKYPYIHPYDDIYTIAGQGTIADEIVLSGKGPFDYIFLQIGGGGMASGVSTWLKIHYPDIKVIGVEAEGQASMKASMDAGKPVCLDEVDTFCDGTAVREPGKLCFKICSETLDDIIVVKNEEVSSAVETTWEIGRFIPEPSGALGLAGLIKYAKAHPEKMKGKKVLSIICGANMDFSKLRLISANHSVGAQRQRYLRFELTEGRGNLLDLLNKYFSGVSVTAFQYGKVSKGIAWPVISFEGTPEALEAMQKNLKKAGVKFEDITGQPDTRYRVINYNPDLLQNPVFMHVHFPERAGALRELLRAISGTANICYFNYVYTGETIGRALMGFELNSVNDYDEFVKKVNATKITCRPLDDLTMDRMLYSEHKD